MFLFYKRLLSNCEFFGDFNIMGFHEKGELIRRLFSVWRRAYNPDESWSVINSLSFTYSSRRSPLSWVGYCVKNRRALDKIIDYSRSFRINFIAMFYKNKISDGCGFLYDRQKEKDCCSTLLLCEIYPFRHRDTYRFGSPLCATKEKACRRICLSFCFKLPKLAIAYRKCYYI